MPDDGAAAISLACPDWELRLRSGRSLIPRLPLDQARAAMAVGVFNKLRIPDVVGQPPNSEAAGDWFREIVGATFGAFQSSGERFIREYLLVVPKKSSKTTGGAGIMMTALILNERPRAEFLLIGPTQAIADTAYSQAVGMVQADEYLRKRYRIQEHLKQILDLKTRAKLKIKTFDSKVLTGVKPIGVLVDELHELGKISYAARVLGQIRGGILPFPEGFLFFITTQSDEAPAGVWLEQLILARKIRDGKADGSMLPIIYEFPTWMLKNDDWRNPKFWWMVTPNRNRPITIARLIEDWHDAQMKGDAEIKRWASQHLNIQIGIALGSDSWAGADFWRGHTTREGLVIDNIDESLADLEILLERSEVVTIGIDGGGLDDLLGLVVLGRERGTGKLLAWFYVWAHEVVKKRRQEIASRLEDFEKAEQITFVQIPGEDVAQLARICGQVYETGLLPAEEGIGVDSYGVAAITKALTAEERGIPAEMIVGISQGWKLNGAIKDTERDLAGGVIKHAGLAIMDWSVGNAKVVARGNAISVDKQQSGSAKIDPLMALFHAKHLMGLNPVASGASGWDTDDQDALERKIEAEIAAQERADTLEELRAAGLPLVV